ncbi:hypothetical protein C2E25_16800 [Geothermobacter hydrogeniphilus]|uniref:Uncharacterized protein n=1 Tax=Geothermobacter hydrogeniphilus TaxID=1969733 RepID=A0A2K2H5U2_9BACT|nr:hypothetical protein [Geothermobacter hydrogeniphilus]PNU18600.1 hypothetical protein C2E25_16800 [Geothermobacter hydrogeniphilus]
MLKEYAVDPACLGDWQTYRYLIEKFGVPQGRLISEFPRKWLRMVYESCSSFSFQQRKKLQIELSRIRKYGLCKSTRSYDGQRDWLTNALEQHVQEPFYAIISNYSDPDKNVLGATEVTETDPLWKAQRTLIVPRKAAPMASAVGKLLSSANHIVFVDPHFGPENVRHRRPFKSFLWHSIMGRKGALPSVEVHTQVKSTEEFFRQECEERLVPLIPSGVCVRFVRWTAREGGQALHNRYILTDIGGVSFQHGLDEGGEGEMDDISLLDRQSYEQRWAEYVGEAQIFDRLEEPFELVGE